MHNPVEARAALRRGNRSRAFETLRTFIEELLERDNMFMAKIACVEFINMMSTVERWPAAARMLDYLEASGAFGDAPVLRTGVADAATKITANIERAAGQEPSPGRELDDRQALAYMRDILDQLADSQQITKVVGSGPATSWRT
jgi:hypothetical protein